MRVYILDEMFFGATTEYTGEELIVYPVKFNMIEICKLKQLNISFTTDPRVAGEWIKHQEYIFDRDFGGCMVMKPLHAIRLNINWNALSKRNREAEFNSEKGQTLKLM